MSYKKESIKLNFNKIKTLVLQRPAKSIKKKIYRLGVGCAHHVLSKELIFTAYKEFLISTIKK